jgi:hypothetical protein
MVNLDLLAPLVDEVTKKMFLFIVCFFERKIYLFLVLNQKHWKFAIIMLTMHFYGISVKYAACFNAPLNKIQTLYFNKSIF